MNRVGEKVSFYTLVGLLNLTVGAVFFTIYGPQVPASLVSAQPVIVKPSPVVPEQRVATSGIPVKVIVPSVGIDLAVGMGTYNPTDGSWTLDDSRAFYADLSVPVNDNNGTTLIYGHAQAPVFVRLPELLPGAEATVLTDNGYVFSYRYESRRDVVPTDISVLKSDGPPTLVLQTCTGPWDMYRTLFSFHFEGVSRGE